MHDPKFDVDQDLLRQHDKGHLSGSLAEIGGPGELGNTLVSICADSHQALSDTAIQALIYTKFVTLSASVRPLIAELEHRSSSNPNELHSLLAECHSAYLSTRAGLLGARVSDEVGKLDPRGCDLVDLVSPSYDSLPSWLTITDQGWVQLPQADLHGRV